MYMYEYEQRDTLATASMVEILVVRIPGSSNFNQFGRYDPKLAIFRLSYERKGVRATGSGGHRSVARVCDAHAVPRRRSIPFV